jgi:hypothetical protein
MVIGSSPIGRTIQSTTYRDEQQGDQRLVPLWYRFVASRRLRPARIAGGKGRRPVFEGLYLTRDIPSLLEEGGL